MPPMNTRPHIVQVAPSLFFARALRYNGPITTGCPMSNLSGSSIPSATDQLDATALPTWWVWRDALLEEWFYSDRAPEETPALLQQLQQEKTVIHQVQASSGAQAIETVSPGYRDSRRQDPITQPTARVRQPH